MSLMAPHARITINVAFRGRADIILRVRFFYRTPASRCLILHDCLILPGDSGGPLLDAGGRLIGINVATTTYPLMGVAVSGASINAALAAPVAGQ